MKLRMNSNRLLLVFISICTSVVMHAQVPSSFAYQAVIRDANGEIWSSNTVSIRTTLFQESVGGPIVYQGIHNTSTNELGLVNLRVGSPDTWISGSLYYAQWNVYAYFLRIEVDLGNGFVDLGAQQLLSVPMAMTAQHAASATQLVGFEIEGAQNGQVIMWDGNNEIWEPSFVQSDWSSDGTNVWRMDGNIGLGTSSPGSGLHLHNKNGLRLSKTFTGSTILDGFYLGQDSFNNGNLYLTNYENADFVFSTNLAERLRITGSGNIGIGTSLPTAPLHIANLNSGGTAFSKWSVLQTGHTANDGSQIGVNASGEMVIEQKENLDILLTRNGSTKVTVNSTGADVNGTLSSDEVNTGMVNALGANLTNVEAYTTNTQFLYVDATAGTGNRPLFVNEDGQVYASGSATNYVSVPGCAFYNWGAGISADQGAYGFKYAIWGEWGAAMAPVDLPQGATIISVSVVFEESSLEENLSIELLRANPLTDDYIGAVMAKCTSSGGVGISTVTDTSINHSIVDNSVYTYYLYLATESNNNNTGLSLDLKNVRIAYTLP